MIQCYCILPLSRCCRPKSCPCYFAVDISCRAFLSGAVAAVSNFNYVSAFRGLGRRPCRCLTLQRYGGFLHIPNIFGKKFIYFRKFKEYSISC